MDLYAKRTAKKMTQEKVAKEVGVSLYTYQKWERGVSTPTVENLKKLISVLGIK